MMIFWNCCSAVAIAKLALLASLAGGLIESLFSPVVVPLLDPDEIIQLK